MTVKSSHRFYDYIWLLVLIVVSVWVLMVCRSGLELQSKKAPAPTQEHDIYLPEPAYLKFISLGHDPLMADLVLARAMTYYGSHYYQRNTFPFRHLQKLFFYRCGNGSP